MVPIYCGCVNTFYVKTGGERLFFDCFQHFVVHVNPLLPTQFMYSLCRTVISVLSGDREKSLVFLLCYTDPFSHNPKEMNEMLRKMKGEKYKKRRTGQKCLTHIHWLQHKRADLLPKQLTSAKEMNDLLGRQTRGLTQLSMLAIAVVTFSLIWYLKGHHLGKLTSERKVECE